MLILRSLGLVQELILLLSWLSWCDPEDTFCYPIG